MATSIARPLERNVTINYGHVRLEGILQVPANAKGIILFAHGSGSSRLSPRNQFVARVLQESKIATLLFDLLGEKEASDRTRVFDIPLLAERLQTGANWAVRQPELAALRLGYFGASTGAAAALSAAARRPGIVHAVVSRGGRPDLASDDLPAVRAPTLLIVGGSDEEVLRLNKQAAKLLTCQHELAVIPGASHLFEEHGALQEVARLAADWFRGHLAKIGPRMIPAQHGDLHEENDHV